MMRFNFTKKKNKKEVMPVIDLETVMAEDEAKKKNNFTLFPAPENESFNEKQEREGKPTVIRRTPKNG